VVIMPRSERTPAAQRLSPACPRRRSRGLRRHQGVVAFCRRPATSGRLGEQARHDRPTGAWPL